MHALEVHVKTAPPTMIVSRLKLIHYNRIGFIVILDTSIIYVRRFMMEQTRIVHQIVIVEI
jgi:hypothetical protein